MPEGDGNRVSYSAQVRPLLAEYCFPCHGPDARARKAGLRLDQRESTLALRGGVAAIVPGDPSRSKLVARITAADAEKRMPPPETEKRLRSEDVLLLRKWIEAGARYEKHWAYVAPRRYVPPDVEDPSWSRMPLDRFVSARLDGAKRSPSREASEATLVRRVFFDLLGLAPAPEELASYSRDLRSGSRPDAFERLLDRLLASPRFGERFAVYWFDLVRFADTTGIHADNTWEVYPYRDYVIDAFNRNLSFDQFTREQLAGDLLPDATLQQQVAASYNRLNMITREGGSQPKEFIAKYMADRVRNVSSVWMAATLGCAECHDHKFDPLTSKEFYQFGAFFSDIEQVGVYSQGEKFNRYFPPYLALPKLEQITAMERFDREIELLQESAVENEVEGEERKKRLAALKKQREDVERQIPVVLRTRAVKPAMVRVLPRGNWMDDSGEVVEPDVPSVFGSLKPTAAARRSRLDLAEWLVDGDHPVVARVFVNRTWRLLFGRGLVTSLDDFGRQGTAPSHPELLDVLSLEFASDWDVKNLFRRLAQSATYRQSSEASPAAKEADPENALLGRQARFRLPAEFIRDNALRVAGLLVDRLGGPSVRPYQPEGYYAHLNFPKRRYQHDKGESLYRRSVYTHWQRQFVHPSFLAFDAPTRERCTVERMESNTPLAALVLLNDPIYVEAARVFAERILAEGGEADGARLEFAHRQIFGRPPVARERRVLATLLRNHRAHFNAHPREAEALLSVGEAPTPANQQPELAAWAAVARVLFNLHETITRY